MYVSIDVLKMLILICFQKMSPESCTVTNLSKILTAEKYAVSRAVLALEKDGMLDRTNPRRIALTNYGVLSAKKYADRMDIVTNHFIYEGVSEEKAQNDAMFFSLYCSDETFGVIQSMEEQYHIKHIFKDRKRFSGTALCEKMKDGCYQFPYIMYREAVKDGSNISMANDGFYHPCKLIIKDGLGMISLKAQNLSHHSAISKEKICGIVNALKYFDGEKFRDSQRNGDVLSFPADVLTFVNIGEDSKRILHGSVCLKMTCSAGIMHMPESKAIFTIMI